MPHAFDRLKINAALLFTVIITVVFSSNNNEKASGVFTAMIVEDI
jgi:hypothetical protein